MMPRRKLKAVPDLPVTPAEPKPPERIRYISRCSLTIFKNTWGQKQAWLTIGQLCQAFQASRRVRMLGLLLTTTDLDLLRFVYVRGAPHGGPHRWRVLGTPMTLVQSLELATFLDPSEIRKSLRRLQNEELIEIHGQEVWTTHHMHRIGAELLWSDRLRFACPKGFDGSQLDWFTVTRDVDHLFTTKKLDPEKAADRRTVMKEIVAEVQRRCTES
jgi:hypothetical protein